VTGGYVDAAQADDERGSVSPVVEGTTWKHRVRRSPTEQTAELVAAFFHTSTRADGARMTRWKTTIVPP
jgi:hypothetical protein